MATVLLLSFITTVPPGFVALKFMLRDELSSSERCIDCHIERSRNVSEAQTVVIPGLNRDLLSRPSFL